MFAARPRATEVTRSTRSRTIRVGAPLSVVALAGAMLAVPGSPASASPTKSKASSLSTAKKVTLVTGDVVRVVTRADGRRSVTIDPGPSGVVPQASISEVGTHLYVVPQSAFALLSAHRVDLNLFDVAGLIKQGYDDASRSTLPVIVDYGTGPLATSRAASAAPAGARRTRSLPLLGAAAFDTDKRSAHKFWSAITGSTSGATRIQLDGRVHVLDVAQPLQQIHVPQAWAAGYDGTGVKIAVLDTGYDATHPDLQGKVSASANFSTDSSVVDGNGHGTHVAGTIAGTGVKSGGVYKGAAPGASLLIGKVLGSDGSGADSQVLAGMQWAVAQHADVVSMSLGGDTGAGTDVLEQAVNELSASSPTLFVIAAGNNGPGATTVTSPGAADAALTVGAVDSTDTIASFSSRGPRLGDGGMKPDVVAPGVDIVADRAAGTSLGNPVDDWYTSLSGTSMATPHVAAVAALVKQEHPTWSGQRIKQVVAASTVPIAGVTSFDVGSGRIDALQAVNQTVVSDASVNLGFFAWPHATLAPRTTQLKYTNLGSTPVTLALGLAGEDGSAAPVGVTLAADRLTVAAGATSSVAVTVDPTVGAIGSYSGVVTASVVGTSQTVRTAVGYVLEDERYNLTVTVQPRPGTQSSAHEITIVGLTDYSFDVRQLDAAPGAQTVTFRVPPESYAVGVTSFGVGADNATESVMAFNPTTTVDRDRTVVLNEATTKEFTYRAALPALTEAAVMSTNWLSPTGSYVGIRMFSTSDRLYAQPMAGVAGGLVDSELNFQLSQPEGEVKVAGTPVLAMRPLTAPDQSVWWAPVAPLSGQLPVVDAGAADHVRLTGVKGAIALVSSPCGDLTSAAASLATAGAAAMIAYPAHGASCAGTAVGTTPLPSFTMRPVAAQQLLARVGSKVGVTTHQNLEYAYDLASNWPTRVPDGATLNATGNKVAALVETYRTQGGTSADGLGVYELMTGWLPGLSQAVFGLSRRVAFPSTVTHYVTAAARWDKEVVVANAANGAYADFQAPGKTYAGGSTVRDTWFGGPLGAYASPLMYDAFGWGVNPNRQGDDLHIMVNTLDDSAGHVGILMFDNEFSAQVYQGGKLILDAFDPFQLEGLPVPSRVERYRLDVSDTRQNLFWQKATTVHNVWGFSSGTPTGEHVGLPLLNVQYAMPLSVTNTAPVGVPLAFTVTFSMPAEVAAVPVVHSKVQVSWDHGVTWSGDQTVRCQPAGTDSAGGHPTACSVVVADQHTGLVSLRVTGTDAAGNTITQTITDAYGVS